MGCIAQDSECVTYQDPRMSEWDSECLRGSFRCTNRVSCITNQDGLIALPEFSRMRIAPSSSARLERLDQLSTTMVDITELFVLLVPLETPDHDAHLDKQYDGFYDS